MSNFYMSKELEDLLQTIEDDERALEEQCALNDIVPSVNIALCYYSVMNVTLIYR